MREAQGLLHELARDSGLLPVLRRVRVGDEPGGGGDVDLACSQGWNVHHVGDEARIVPLLAVERLLQVGEATQADTARRPDDVEQAYLADIRVKVSTQLRQALIDHDVRLLGGVRGPRNWRRENCQ